VNHEEVISKIQENLSAKEISHQMSISTALVHKIAKENSLRVYLPKRTLKYDYESAILEFQKTNNLAHSCRVFGIPSASSLSREIKRRGIEYSNQTGRKKISSRTLQETFSKNPLWEDIYYLYSQWKNQTRVAKTLKVSQPTVSFALRSMGVLVGRGKNHPKAVHSQETLQKMHELYTSGKTEKEIADIYQVTEKIVSTALMKTKTQKRVGKAVGKDNPQWKGGKSKEKPVHYYRRLSYEVCAICLQKPVPRGHVIHHLDENPKNNDPGNLMIFPSQSHHAKFHQKVLHLQGEALKDVAIQKALEYGAYPLPESQNLFEFLDEKV
jgi:DNA-binding CsgD family transcriptional regulator